MADNSDYQLEEMENSAVNKSTMAKRMAAGAGLLAAGAATAYGAEQLMGDDGSDNGVATEHVQQPDLTSGAAAGAVGEGVAGQTQSQPEPQTVHTEEDVHVYHHYVEDPKPEPEPEMEFESTTHLYDDEGNLVGTVDGGSYAGRDFAVVDNDADGHGDVLWYDENGDGKISQNELSDISDSNYAMGQHGGEHHDVNINTGEEVLYAHTQEVYDPYTDPLADIHNDFDDEKSGEEYSDDLAQNNQDYRNDEDVHQYDEYHAGVDNDDTLVAEEDGIEATGDVYDDDPQDDTLYAEDDTLDDDNTEDYALNEDVSESTEDYALNDDVQNDDDYSADDSADDDMAYNDDVQNDDVDDSIDDTDQYDIV